jgi:23S rRNA pseudouridine2605 synthase
MIQQRLQKILAAAGVASRRKAEEIILAGRVRVNGEIVRELGSKADPARDRIEVDGRLVLAEDPVVLVLNKPRGVVSTASDPEGRETVVDLVREIGARIYPVGRLDYGTSGALLLTNFGELAHALTHPRFGVEKIYLVKVRGPVPNAVLDRWRKGVELEDGKTKPAEVFKVEENDSYTWIQIAITEGRNRQIRRMAEATGLDVSKLKRVSFAGITIEGIRPGQWRELTDRELSRLKRDHLNPARRQERKRARNERSST